MCPSASTSYVLSRREFPFADSPSRDYEKLQQDKSRSSKLPLATAFGKSRGAVFGQTRESAIFHADCISADVP